MRRGSRGMSHRLVNFLLATLLFFLCSGFAESAEAPQVYVSNKIAGTALKKGGIFYVALEGLMKATKGGISVEEQTGKITVKDTPLQTRALRSGKGWLVPVREVGEALGYQYRYTQQTGMIDLFKKAALRPEPVSRPGGESSEERHRHINRGAEGQEITIQNYLVSGKTNIFDFYSDYCPPCREVAPLLEVLAKRRTDVVVNKVDINRPGVEGIDWSSPVALQYNLHSIPHFKVFDASGRLLAEGEPASQMVMQLLQSMGR